MYLFVYFFAGLLCIQSLYAVRFKGINYYISDRWNSTQKDLPGTMRWWLICKYGLSQEDGTYCAFFQTQIDATSNNIRIAIDKKKHLKYIEQAIVETDLVKKKITRAARSEIRWGMNRKASVEAFKKCIEKIAQEKMYFIKLLETVKNLSVPTVGEQDLLRLFIFFRHKPQQDYCGFYNKIMMTKKKSVWSIAENLKQNTECQESFQKCDWPEAWRVIYCHRYFINLIRLGWISCNAQNPQGLLIPWYYPRYMNTTAYRPYCGTYGPCFQEKLTDEECKKVKKGNYWGELPDVYDIDGDPRTQWLKTREDKIKALCKRPSFILFAPFKRLLYDVTYEDC